MDYLESVRRHERRRTGGAATLRTGLRALAGGIALGAVLLTVGLWVRSFGLWLPETGTLAVPGPTAAELADARAAAEDRAAGRDRAERPDFATTSLDSLLPRQLRPVARRHGPRVPPAVALDALAAADFLLAETLLQAGTTLEENADETLREDVREAFGEAWPEVAAAWRRWRPQAVRGTGHPLPEDAQVELVERLEAAEAPRAREPSR